MARAISQYAADNRGQIVRFSGSSPAHSSSRSAPQAWSGSEDEGSAPWRAIGVAALVALALVVVSGGKAY